ncbi:tripartite tricarboxylate transporter substrate binding protein [Ramlibacter henchirensis]|uniref:Tripartite tricarboxylate transporter substrate binding protein n=1 Tax=Ramlibacter henchirensis TaxID=204072 RepID=A0A4Z0BU49_9BURK|nr:tripartite tricarboxylate transporter substrate binding protein [Ramlibacter henchirensis]TFZ02823.1 tripartite tricarboxylate transporter substrate binding protein [Ramlibacter henchirensis]
MRSSKWMGLLAALGFAVGTAVSAGAQTVKDFPNRPVKLVVPFSPGGSVDLTARSIESKLAELLKVPVLVENKPGAAAVLGTQAVVTAPPDGYTLLVGSTSMSIRPHLKPPPPYDPAKDLLPITLAAKVPHVLLVPPSLNVKSVADLSNLYKTKKTPIMYGDVGQGSLHYLAGDLFKAGSGIDITHVSYKGTSNVVADLLGGHVQLGSVELSVAGPYMASGQLVAIGLSVPTRHPEWPNLPTIAEQGVADYDISSWFGFFAPARTPPEIIDLLNREMVKALSDPGVKATYAKAGLTPVGTSVAEFRKQLEKEHVKWGAAVKISNPQ